jgi:hypothetical protein
VLGGLQYLRIRRPTALCSLFVAATRRLQRNTSDDSSNYSNGHNLAVVHTHADGLYDRSSFHVAGSPCLVADLASQSATRAVQPLPSLGHEEVSNSTTGTPHPTVGLVEHVAVLPLAHNDEPLTAEEWIEASDGLLSIDIISKNKDNIVPSRTVPYGWVARAIVHVMESKAGVGVFSMDMRLRNKPHWQPYEDESLPNSFDPCLLLVVIVIVVPAVLVRMV